MSDPADLLEHGEIVVDGRLVEASNATLFCRAVGPSGEVRCVYKPVAGERPLWVFPDGTIASREVAAYQVSEAAGWHLVPPTVLRDGPFGPGMCQLWVHGAGEELVDVLRPAQVPDDWLRVLEALDGDGQPVVLVHADDPRLRQIAVFDVVINNADRKGGHVVVTADGAVLGVDHGVSFHVEDKLRTVLWGWSGAALTADERATLHRLNADLGNGLADRLAGLLAEQEVSALRDRISRLLAEGRLPGPDGRRRPIPWPPF